MEKFPPDLPPPVRHRPEAHRYELSVGRLTAFTEYRDEDGRRIFYHTFVPPELRRKGLAGAVVRRALNDSRAENRRVRPDCSYVAGFIQKNPEFKVLLD